MWVKKMGLIWSSANDVIARVFEVMAMELVPICNRLPGLGALGFQEWKHYIGFSSIEEATEKVLWAKAHPETAKSIAREARKYVVINNMTWDSRCQSLLHKFGMA